MNEYYKNLPRKWMGAGALFFNNDNKFLIVKPTYGKEWEIPGGNIEEGESPFNSLKREVKEELGIDINEAGVLCVEYRANIDDKGDRVQFIFNGGTLTQSQIEAIRLPADELSEYKFVSLEEGLKLLGGLLHDRVTAAFQAHAEKRVIYLEKS